VPSSQNGSNWGSKLQLPKQVIALLLASHYSLQKGKQKGRASLFSYQSTRSWVELFQFLVTKIRLT
jgi:hypothetical protein